MIPGHGAGQSSTAPQHERWDWNKRSVKLVEFRRPLQVIPRRCQRGNGIGLVKEADCTL